MRSPSSRSSLAAALILAAALAAPQVALAADPATTVVLVRHAEKAKAPQDDPPLTEEGQRRAGTLAHVAGALGVDAVFTSQYARTRQTAAPLAEALGLEPIEYDAGDSQALVDRVLSEHRGQTVLIAGHSNTVPPLIGLFGGPELPLIDGRVYDDLFVLVIPAQGEPTLLHLRYGSVTPLPTPKP